MPFASAVRWQPKGNADTRGLSIENLRESDEQRRITWLVAPVHDPDWYVSDTSFHLRSAGHVYTLPGPERGSGFDGAAWAAPGVENLRQIKPPSGFPNLCVRIDTAQTEVYKIRIYGLDCLLRKMEETITLDNTGGAGGTVRAWGYVGWRQIHKIEVVSVPTLVAEDLRIGWDFVNTQVVATFYDTPEYDDDGAGAPNWLLGMPFKMRRDNLLGVNKVHNVDGAVQVHLSAWPIFSDTVTPNRNHPILALGGLQGGWIGSDAKDASMDFNNGYFGNKTIDGQTRTLWSELNVWAPPANSRPLFSSGKDGGPLPINTATLNMYCFFLHEWRVIPGLQDFED